MKVEDVRAVLRPRSAWQAVDLGCLLWQRSVRSVCIAWFATALPLVALCLGLGGGPTPLAVFLFWWCFPVASRGVLFVLSRALFGDESRGWAALQAPWGFRARGLFRTLVLSRLSPLRTFSTPVGLLEGLGGAARRKRVSVLERSTGSTFMSALLSLGLVLCGGAALLASIELFKATPFTTSFELAVWEEPWLMFGAWFLAVSFVEPLHVAIGFSLYLDGRSHVEGWDVEIGLRVLQKRIAASRRPGLACSAIAVLAIFGVLGSSGQEMVPQGGASSIEFDADDPRAVIDRVLADEDFGTLEERWVPKFPWEFPDPDGDPPPFAWLAEILGRIFLVLFYALILALLVTLVVMIVRTVQARNVVVVEEPDVPTSIVEAALAGGEAALPADVSGAVRELVAQGLRVEAAGLLYRASLVALVERHDVVIEPSDTESACLRRTRRTVGEAGYLAFRSVTHLWQSAAYASLDFGEEQLEGALAGYHRLREGLPS